MAYDEDLAHRLRELLAEEDAVTEKRMFGGLAFLLNGNMSVSASRNGGLLVRIDPGDTEAALARPHVALMEMRGRTMPGWITVAPEGVKTKRDLGAWVKRSVAFVRTLPPKLPRQASSARSAARSVTRVRPETRLTRAPTTAPPAPATPISSWEAIACVSTPASMTSAATVTTPTTAPATSPSTTRT